MDSVKKFQQEMQARVDELRPYVEEYAQIEQLLQVMDSVKGKVVAYAEDTVPAFDKKPKRKPYTKRARKRVPNGNGVKTRVGLVKKYLKENGTKELRGTKEYTGRTSFTFGSLMNAMDADKYGGYTWPRSNSEVLDRLVELGVLELVHVVQSKRTRKYYAIGTLN